MNLTDRLINILNNCKVRFSIIIIIFVLFLLALIGIIENKDTVRVEAIVGKCVYYKVPIKEDTIRIVDCGNGYRVSKVKVVDL